jgi:AraC-like DNA-binding protein
LNERDGIRPKLVPPRGVLFASPVKMPAPGYARFWPAPDLAPYVEHFWTVAWDVAAPETHEVLPHPSVQLVLEAGRSRLAGVHRGRFVARLEGRGRVLGTKFRPGGFRPFLGGAVASLTGRTVGLTEIFGARAHGLEARALAVADRDPVAAFQEVQSFLRACAPARDPSGDLAARITERAAADREVKRVEELADAFGLTVRGLQRLFAEYVGVSPKWVIQRYRLHEAAERIAAGETAPGAELALELGYADQAHFIRDFRRLVGWTPAAYARAVRARQVSRRAPEHRSKR